jgi:hypothetical protein
MANETVRVCRGTLSFDILVEGLDGAKLAPGLYSVVSPFTDGTGDGQVTQVWMDLGKVSGGADTLDLDGLTDFQGGSTSTCTKLKGILINNLSTTNNVTVGGGDFTAFFSDATDILVIKPETCFLLLCRKGSYTITASTGDGLLITGTSGQTYDIILLLSA